MDCIFDGVVVCRFWGTLLGGSLEDDVGRVVVFEAESIAVSYASRSRATGGACKERGWWTGRHGQGWSTWRGAHLHFFYRAFAAPVGIDREHHVLHCFDVKVRVFKCRVGACDPVCKGGGIDDVVDGEVHDFVLKDKFRGGGEMAAPEHVETFEGFVMWDQERRARGGLRDVGKGGGEDGGEVGGEVEVGEGDGHCVRLGDEQSKDEVDEDVGVLDVH